MLVGTQRAAPFDSFLSTLYDTRAFNEREGDEGRFFHLRGGGDDISRHDHKRTRYIEFFVARLMPLRHCDGTGASSVSEL